METGRSGGMVTTDCSEVRLDELDEGVLEGWEEREEEQMHGEAGVTEGEDEGIEVGCWVENGRREWSLFC